VQAFGDLIIYENMVTNVGVGEARNRYGSGAQRLSRLHR
jgi:hypothetical protein